MRRAIPFIAAAVLAIGVAPARSTEMKPGLWEVHPIRHEMDGKDTLADMNAAREKIAAMADKLPAAQREKLLGGHPRICVTPEAAAKGLTTPETAKGCEPTRTTRAGDKVAFEFKCVRDGRTTVGKGESLIGGDTAHTRVEMTTTGPKGVNVTLSESEMKWLRADCGDVRPLDLGAK